ncbi:MAG: universal stress protein [Syntrophobacteraceae bacterium]
MKVKTILWPTDYSSAAAIAESYVLSLSEKHGARVHLLHVAEDLTRFEHYWGSGLDEKHTRDLREFVMRAAEKRLEKLCQKRLTQCPLFERHITLGDPPKEIVKVAEEVGADVVVMATRGGKGSFPFGSVAEKVVESSTVPVLTVDPRTYGKG